MFPKVLIFFKCNKSAKTEVKLEIFIWFKFDIHLDLIMKINIEHMSPSTFSAGSHPNPMGESSQFCLICWFQLLYQMNLVDMQMKIFSQYSTYWRCSHMKLLCDCMGLKLPCVIAMFYSIRTLRGDFLVATDPDSSKFWTNLETVFAIGTLLRPKIGR